MVSYLMAFLAFLLSVLVYLSEAGRLRAAYAAIYAAALFAGWSVYYLLCHSLKLLWLEVLMPVGLAILAYLIMDGIGGWLEKRGEEKDGSRG
jgi:peptidoglycan/LPS O-acetylase OafA/YrhL